MPRDATRSGSIAMAGADRLDRLLRDARIRGPVAVGDADAADVFAIGEDPTTPFHRTPPFRAGGERRAIAREIAVDGHHVARLHHRGLPAAAEQAVDGAHRELPPCGGPARILRIQEEMHVWVGPLDFGDRAAERRRLLAVVL